MLWLLTLYLALALGVSFLCSLLEASLLSVPDSHVQTMVNENKPSGRLLRSMKSNIDQPLAAILTLNTVAHTVGAAGVGAEAAAIWGHQWIALASAVLTVLILVLSEIIPKTLGAVHDKRLAGFTAYTTGLLIKITWPAVWLCNRVSDLVGGRREQHRLSREEVHSIAQIGRESGVLDEYEAHTIRNLLALRNVQVKDVMTPRSVVFALPRDTTVGDVVAREELLPYARIPVYRDNLDNVDAVVHRYRIFEAHRQGRDGVAVAELAAPIHAVPETATIADALNAFVERQEQLFVAVDEHGGVEGIVTLEDAMETMLGVEIVDETDRETDMRELAARQAERRRRGRGH